MDIYVPTFDTINEKARAKFRKAIEKHLEELQAAYAEYLDADVDKSERRETELQQYLCKGCDDAKAFVYHRVMSAIHRMFPKASKPVPEFAPTPMPHQVKSVAEAREKGYSNYVIVEEGQEMPVPEAWQDKNIQWTGHSVTPIVPTLNDSNNPARMTREGEVYYRND